MHRESGGRILFAGSRGTRPLTLAPVAVFNQKDETITPRGAHWSVRRHGNRWIIALSLTDPHLPVPYTIDPQLTAGPTSQAWNAVANWELEYTPTNGTLVAGDTITVTFNGLSAYNFPAYPRIQVLMPTSIYPSTTCTASAVTTASPQLPQAPVNSAKIVITLANAPGQVCSTSPGTDLNFSILDLTIGQIPTGFFTMSATSSEDTSTTTTVVSLINSQPPTAVTFYGSPQAAGTSSTWTISFNAAPNYYQNELVGGSTITVTFPTAFGLPAHPSVTLTNMPDCTATASTQGNVVTITLGEASDEYLPCQGPEAGDVWYGGEITAQTVSLGGITNPPTGDYPASSFSVMTSSQNPAASPAHDVTILSPEDFAYKYVPVLNFDNTEKWRPLNVDMFLSEIDPSSGTAWNQVCSTELGCSSLSGTASLGAYPADDAYISMHRDGSSDPDSYTSPNPACNTTNSWGTTLHDCDSGSASAIYYNIAGPSPGGYTYVEYWVFYRYNQAFENQGNHAGDWEGVTVVPSPDGSALEWVELSHHGAWDSYLPSSLDCGASQGTCSTPAAENSMLSVDSFPAAGSHANYPQPNDSDPDDNGNNGLAAWGNNLTESALLPLPTPAGDGVSWTSGPENWTDWPGAWGDTPQTQAYFGTWSGSPCSPAAPLSAADGHCGADHGGHYYAPWSQTGTNLNCSGGACPEIRSARVPESPVRCGSWFGGGVAVAACDEARMERAIRSQRGMQYKGTFTLSLRGRHAKTGSAPGVAQLLATPLRPGTTAVISGFIPRGTEVSVRARRGRYLETATFAGFRQIHGKASVEIRSEANGRPEAILKIGRIALTPNVTTRTTLTRRELAGLEARR